MPRVLSRRQSKDKTALKRSAQRTGASRRGEEEELVSTLVAFFPPPFSSPFFFSFPSFFPFSRNTRSRAHTVSRFACRVGGRGSRREQPRRKEEEAASLLLSCAKPLRVPPPLGTDFATFKKRLKHKPDVPTWLTYESPRVSTTTRLFSPVLSIVYPSFFSVSPVVSNSRESKSTDRLFLLRKNNNNNNKCPRVKLPSENFSLSSENLSSIELLRSLFIFLSRSIRWV